MNKLKSSCLAIVSALLVVSGLSSTVLGAWRATGTTTNYISTAKYGSVIVNEFKPPKTIKPDTYIEDVVNVKNVGETPVLVRVKFNRGFANKDLKGDNILLDLDLKNWYDGGDGYYYYKGILDKNETTKHPILKGFTLNSVVEDDYKSQKGNIEATAESIQYYGDFLKEVWGVSYKNLGISKPSNEYKIEKSKVVFNGSTFEYTGEDKGDLFLDFKQMVSGSVRTQPIDIVNSSNKRVKIKISTMFSKDSEDILKDLISKYVTITIKDTKGNTLYSGSIGGNGTEVDLGDFNIGETKELIVTASVSREINTDYSNLKGSVIWGFTADDLTVYLAKTSDTYLLFVGIGLLVLGLVGYSYSCKKRKEVTTA